VHFTIYMYLYLYSYRREIARQLRMYAQLTRCFSAVAELLVITLMHPLLALSSSSYRMQLCVSMLMSDNLDTRCSCKLLFCSYSKSEAL